MSESLGQEENKVHTIFVDAKLIPLPVRATLELLYYTPHSSTELGIIHGNLLSIGISENLPGVMIPQIPIGYEWLKRILDMFKSYQNRGGDKEYVTNLIQEALYPKVISSKDLSVPKLQKIGDLSKQFDDSFVVEGDYSLVIKQRDIDMAARKAAARISLTMAVASNMHCMAYGQKAPEACVNCRYGALRASTIQNEFPQIGLNLLQENSGSSIAGCTIAKRSLLDYQQELITFEQEIDRIFEETYDQRNQTTTF